MVFLQYILWPPVATLSALLLSSEEAKKKSHAIMDFTWATLKDECIKGAGESAESPWGSLIYCRG